jgi:tartrate-resistant acid phosphatase type 5
MSGKLCLGGFLVCCLFAFTTLSFAEQNPPQLDVEAQLVHRLPNDWKQPATLYSAFSRADNRLLEKDDAELCIATLGRLMQKPGAEEFVAAHLDQVLKTSAAVNSRVDLLYTLTYFNTWIQNPIIVPLLERVAATNPDPDVSIAAVKVLHLVEARRLQVIVSQRLKPFSSNYASNKDEVDRLEKEDEKLLYITDEITLPEYMEKPPVDFKVPVKSGSIRAVMIGDFGTRGEDQHRVAASMVQYHRKKPFDFGITLGDNFYFTLQSPDDPGFNVAFEDLYGPMNITFYPVFGNHDWDGDLPIIEMLHSHKSSHWYFPAPYYTYTAGPVQFFAINTGLLDQPSAAQLRWLQTELDASQARWKIVYGHYPIVSSRGIDYDILPGLYAKLIPVLRGRADVYLAGHIHSLQQHKPEEGINFFIIGGSGAGKDEVSAADPDSLFAKEAYGFGVLEADDHTLTIRIVDEDGKELHVASFHK